jgi:hypothetical protein
VLTASAHGDCHVCLQASAAAQQCYTLYRKRRARHGHWLPRGGEAEAVEPCVLSLTSIPILEESDFPRHAPPRQGHPHRQSNYRHALAGASPGRAPLHSLQRPRKAGSREAQTGESPHTLPRTGALLLGTARPVGGGTYGPPSTARRRWRCTLQRQSVVRGGARSLRSRVREILLP